MAAKDREDLQGLDPSSRIKLNLTEQDDHIAQAKLVQGHIKDDIFMIRLRQLAWKEYCRINGDGAEVQKSVMSILDESGLKEQIKTATVKVLEQNKAINSSKSKQVLHPRTARFSKDESIDCIRNARTAWEMGINEELQAIAAESKRPFLTVRNAAELNTLIDLNIVQAPTEGVKFLFDSEDLLETGIAIQNPNMNPALADRYMGLLKLNLPVPSLDDLIEKFAELACGESQFGVDDGHAGTGAKFLTARHDEGESVLQQGSVLDARLYLRRGVAPGLRARMWRRACGLNDDALPSEEHDFLRLRVECDRLDLMTDELFLHDILTVLDDPRYFIFDEELKEIIFCFSRDETVRELCHYQIHAPLLNKLQPTFPATAAMPPCAVQPFLGFATYFAPLCYVIKPRASLYTMSRLLFCQLWCRLNVLSGDANTLLPVCKLFEVLLLQMQPRLFMHLVNIGLQPLKIAFSWIQLGFVGLLEVDQLLLLWDRVIGFMDLNVFAVAAVAIFVTRTEPLFKCTSEAEATMVLNECSRLRLVPLMQMLLFRDSRPT